MPKFFFEKADFQYKFQFISLQCPNYLKWRKPDGPLITRFFSLDCSVEIFGRSAVCLKIQFLPIRFGSKSQQLQGIDIHMCILIVVHVFSWSP